MAEPFDTILSNYTDPGEKDSVRAALANVVEDMVGKLIVLPSIPAMKQTILLDVVREMQVQGHVFTALPRSGAVANSAEVLAAQTAWFVGIYKATAAAQDACRSIFGTLNGDPAGAGAGGAAGLTVNDMAAVAAAAAVKASQVTTEEDKSKQGKGQQVRNSQLDLDMKNKTISSAIAKIVADSSIPAGTEKSYEAFVQLPRGSATNALYGD